MNEIVQINIEVYGLESESDRVDFAQSVAEHLLETFNDDESIKACHYKLVTEGRTEKEKILLAALLTLRAESTGEIDSKGLLRAQRQADKAIKLLTDEKKNGSTRLHRQREKA